MGRHVFRTHHPAIGTRSSNRLYQNLGAITEACCRATHAVLPFLHSAVEIFSTIKLTVELRDLFFACELGIIHLILMRWYRGDRGYQCIAELPGQRHV